MIVRARLIVKGWEASRSEKENKVILGYLKCFDVDTTSDFSLGTTFVMDNNKIDRTEHVYDLDLSLKDAYGKLNGTCHNIQIAANGGK